RRRHRRPCRGDPAAPPRSGGAPPARRRSRGRGTRIRDQLGPAHRARARPAAPRRRGARPRGRRRNRQHDGERPMTPPRTALIGHGYWGRNLARNLNDLGALAAIAERDPAMRESAQAAYPETACHADMEPVLADPEIAAVAIATPAATHGELVARALEAGKHVFVEKPLCLDVAEAERLAADAARRGRVLMVGHLLLYHPAFVALRA